MRLRRLEAELDSTAPECKFQLPEGPWDLGFYPPGVWLRHTPGFFYLSSPRKEQHMPDRAVIFIDGNNWYHSLRNAGVDDLALLNYAKISRKLLGPRDWLGTRYYIGQVQQHTNTRLYADQRRFLTRLQATDSRITCHLGRLETHLEKNEAARELREYLASLRVRIDKPVFHALMALAQRHEQIPVTVEKAVDVMLAVDMVEMAQRDEYDAAYLLSADGDLTPAVRAVRGRNKKVYGVSPAYGAQLGAAVNSFIRLDRAWFQDCYSA